MVQPRPIFAWSLLGLLTCLLVLNLTVAPSLDGVFHNQKSVDVIPSQSSEQPKSIAIAVVSPCERKTCYGIAGDVTAVRHPPFGEVRAISTVETGQGGPVIACSNNDDAGEATAADPPHYPRTEVVFLPAPENPRSVAAEGQVGVQVAETPQPQNGAEGGPGPSLATPETIQRLPAVVANMPAPIHAAPRRRSATIAHQDIGIRPRAPSVAPTTRGGSRRRCWKASRDWPPAARRARGRPRWCVRFGRWGRRSPVVRTSRLVFWSGWRISIAKPRNWPRKFRTSRSPANFLRRTLL